MPFIPIDQLKPERAAPYGGASPGRGSGAGRAHAGPAAVDLSISGMHCASCVAAVERALGTVAGSDIIFQVKLTRSRFTSPRREKLTLFSRRRPH